MIFSFSKHKIEAVIATIEGFLPFLKGTLTSSLEKQKQNLFKKVGSEIAEESKPLIATLWEILITVMIVYFLISIIEGLVNDRINENKEKATQDKEN